MRLEQVELKATNPLLNSYQQQGDVAAFFHYEQTQEAFEQRLNDLKNHPVRRQELADIIRDFMAPYGLSPKDEQHLKELEENAVAVVGGQQAGLLTGPLYSVHKAITVIVLANEQREKLGVPVVPVFWIAGEDHDIDEINHTFTSTLHKVNFGEKTKHKKQASYTVLDRVALTEWVKEIFASFGETAYTKELLASVLAEVEQTTTFTDFFVRLMHGLFKEYGLLMLDAADEKLRAYEAPYFERLIDHSEEIAKVVTAREAHLVELGYPMPIGATEDAANLFYTEDGARYLLVRKDGKFLNHAANVHFTVDEMKQQAAAGHFSNNVVTRPMMQDMVLPVLSFVGGPGELAYWSTLKEGFETLGMKVPVFTPRLNITMVTSHTQALLDDLQLTVKDALEGKVDDLRESFKAQVYDKEAQQTLETTKRLIEKQYAELHEHVIANDLHVNTLVDKNLNFHKSQLDFMMRKIEQEVLMKHDVAMRRFGDVERDLLPLGGFQERTYTPYPYLNDYGMTLVDDLLTLPYTIDGRHQIVYL